jgi:hypothetical protein
MIFEGIYWLGLSASAGYSVQSFLRLISANQPVLVLLNSFLLSVVPTILEGIILPIILFVLAVKLNPNKPIGAPIKWGFITGTIMIAAFWLVNTSIWVSVIRLRGIEYLWNVIVQVEGGQLVTFHPEHLVSFITSVFGLLAIMIYTGYLTTKSTRIEAIQNLRLGSIGIVILGLGLFYLWNYYSWVLAATLGIIGTHGSLGTT